MSEIDSVESVERWVFADLSTSTFSEEDQQRVLDDIHRLEEHLTTWNRELIGPGVSKRDTARKNRMTRATAINDSSQ